MILPYLMRIFGLIKMNNQINQTGKNVIDLQIKALKKYELNYMIINIIMLNYYSIIQ